MARYVTKLHTRRPPDEVFAYMADLRNFPKWDPGVRRVAQVEGQGGGLGAVFDVTVRARRDQTLRYRTAVFDPPREVLVVAKTTVFTQRQRTCITLAADDAGTIVTYNAHLRFNGPLRIGDPLLQIVFRRLGSRASAGLRRVLEGEQLA